MGTGIALQKAKAKARQYAQADAAILLHGETGVGKELFAHAIHKPAPAGTSLSWPSTWRLCRSR